MAVSRTLADQIQIVSSQGLKFSADLKLGQTYMKIPPKLLFKVQVASTLVSSLTQVGVLNWMLVNIPSLCNTDAIDGFSWYVSSIGYYLQ
jgi:OPT oligopeptide transporter protein